MRAWLISLLLAVAASSQPLVLHNATVHTAVEEAFVGYVVVQDGKILQVGRGQAPAGERLDLGGGHLYPGLIDADTALGLVDVESLRASRDHEEVGRLNPNLRAAVAYRADSDLIPVARSQGVLLAGVNPVGGLVAGQGSVMQLWGWTWEEATVRPSWAMAVSWPNLPLSDQEDEKKNKEAVKSLGEQLYVLDEAFAEARTYTARSGDVKWEALKPYAEGKSPVLLRCSGKAEIQAALDWSEKEKIRPVLVCGRDVHLFAATLATRQIPVIYSTLNSTLPRLEESASLFHRTPGILRQAGVLVALSPSGMAFDVRELRDLAGKAAGNGMTRLQALQSVTLSPARILGIESRAGSIEKGKDATLVLADGDLLETTPRVLRAWGQGVELDLRDRQKELYDKYRSRPRP